MQTVTSATILNLRGYSVSIFNVISSIWQSAIDGRRLFWNIIESGLMRVNG